jgi:lysophospholipase L1-like esterase
MEYIEVPDIPDIPSPGMLGATVYQDLHRSKFDNESRMLRLCGISLDAVYIGDSLTESWPVDRLLRDLFPHSVNRGVGGDTARHLPARLEADVLALQPRNVVLMIGTNDVSIRFGYDTDDVIVADYTANMTQILERIHATPARCFVGTIPPTRRLLIRDQEYERKFTCIPRMNAVLRDLAARLGMVLVDYHPHFFDRSGALREDLFSDAVHFNTRGQYLLTQVLRWAVEEASARGGNVVRVE